MDLRGRSLLKEIGLSAGEFRCLVDLGARLRLERRMGERMHRLADHNIALVFEKASTRTRAAFEVAAPGRYLHFHAVAVDHDRTPTTSGHSRRVGATVLTIGHLETSHVRPALPRSGSS
jgi:ornithine carbamoyltransferase